MPFKIGDVVPNWRTSTLNIISDDEDSLGPASLSYEVNMVNGGATSAAGATGVRKPQALPPVDPAVLANTDPWVKALFDRFDMVEKNNSDRSDAVEQKLANYQAQVQTVMEEQAKTTRDVAKLQSEMDDVTTEVEDAHSKIGEVAADLDAFKRETTKKLNELVAKFDAKSSTVSVQMPSLSAAQQCTVEDKFQALLGEAKALQTIFVVGKVPGTRPSVSLTTLMQRHFEEHGAKLLPQAGKARTRRFSVPLDKVESVKNIVRHYNLAIRDLGYWIVQDAPPALRKLNSNAYAFFKSAKSNYGVLRRSRFEVESGYVMIDDVPFLPVYLVPMKQKKWKALAGLLTELVANFVDSEWLETATSQFTVPPDFAGKWCAILERDEQLELPVEQPGTADDDDEMFDFDAEEEKQTTSGGG